MSDREQRLLAENAALRQELAAMREEMRLQREEMTKQISDLIKTVAKGNDRIAELLAAALRKKVKPSADKPKAPEPPPMLADDQRRAFEDWS